MNSSHRERQIARASEALTARGGGFVDLPTLLPASLVLELAGESLRPRLFFATAPDGSEMCLRPDLTIPAVVQYIADSDYDNDPFAWACKGQVFRAARAGEDRPPEFCQIGLERFGDADVIETDVAIYLAALQACLAADNTPLQTRFCDGGLLARVIAGADLPAIWQTALLEQTNHKRAFLNTLALASGQIKPRQLTPLEQDIADLSPQEASARVQAALVAGELVLAGGRNINDITQRLSTRAKRALSPTLSPAICETLLGFARFAQTTTLHDSLKTLVAMGNTIGIDLRAWQQDWQARFDAIAHEASEALAWCRFDALAEEAFDYYDGMAFDISIDGDFSRPLATGGRYDQLVGEVSAGTRQARAIGCVIRPDRFGADANGEA